MAAIEGCVVFSVPQSQRTRLQTDFMVFSEGLKRRREVFVEKGGG